ncbi:MAG: 4Fe-4S dicluster domain-containing protein, partial [Endomicrobiia bacterium]
MDEIIQQIKDAGIVGAGGAGFPTYFKLESAKGKVDTYIINAAECEPLLKVDQQILKVYAEEIIFAAVKVGEYLGVKKIIIGIKEKYHETIDVLETAIKQYSNIELYLLDNFYPAGDEFTLINEVTDRIIPEGGLPINVGCVVNNVVTILNIYNAIKKNVSVTNRVVSVVGEVKNPMTLVVPVGTVIKELIKLCGGTKIENFRIIDGGPMMGKLISDEDVVTKRTSGILVLPSDHPIVIMKTMSEHQYLYQIKSACEQCQDCTEICPRYLLGHEFECHKIQRSVSYQMDELLTQAFLCCECGLCDWVCPMYLLPRRTNQMVKQMLIKKGIKNPHNKKPTKVRMTKDYRKVPVERLISRFDINKYVSPALLEVDVKDIDFVKIPLVQHIGIKPSPIVKVGDIVKKNDLIAEVRENKLGCNHHASIDGKIVERS